MSKFTATAFLGMSLVLGSAAAFAQDSTVASLDEIEGKGKVSINRGEEFVPAGEGMRVKPGDRIMVQDDSSVEIKFDDECEYEVEENRIVTVPERSPCAGGAPLVQELNPAGTGAVGAAGGSDASSFILGSVAAVGIWLYFLEDDTDTVSP